MVGIEPAFPRWQRRVLAFVRHLQVGGGSACCQVGLYGHVVRQEGFATARSA